MKNRTQLKDISSKVGEEVLVSGFARIIRKQSSIIFIILVDVSSKVQLVVTKDNEELFKSAESLNSEDVIEVTGVVKSVEQAPNGIEIEVLKIDVLSHADPELPIPVVIKGKDNETDITKRLDYRWLDLRKEENLRIFKLWTSLEKGFRKFFSENNFIQVYTPSFMTSPSESGAEVFEVKYFDRKAYLAQSPQFYKQMAMASGFEKVFMVGSVFRAEPSFTTRHLTEFTGWDFEVSYIEDHYDIMSIEENAIIEGFKAVREDLNLDIEIPTVPFPKMTMVEAKELLRGNGVVGEKVNDFSPEEEKELSKIVKEKYNHDFVFVTDYSINVRPFYHMRYGEDNRLTKSFDLLYRGVEITTGAQREHRYDVLLEQAKDKNMNLEELSDYLNFFRYGCPPHGGVGIGPGRIVMSILNLPSVKEATFLPRDVKRLRP